MSLELNFDSFPDRVRILYQRSLPFIDKTDAEPGVFEERLDRANRISASWSARGLSEDEKIKVLSTALSAISAIADFKDHLNKELQRQNKDRNSFEQAINNNRALGIVIDLNNASKHGTPLKRYYRVSKRPALKNLQRAFRIGNTPGRPSVFAMGTGEATLEGTVDLPPGDDADLRSTIVGAFNATEDFIVCEIGNTIEPAASRRSQRIKEEAFDEALNKAYPIVLSHISNPQNWQRASLQELTSYSIVKPSLEDIDAAHPFEFGVILPPASNTPNGSIEIFSLLMGEQHRYSVARGIDIFSPIDPEISKIVYEHYHKSYNREQYF